VTTLASYLGRVNALARTLRARRCVLSGEAAAHLHIAHATGTELGGEARYLALVPRKIEVVIPAGEPDIEGVVRDARPVSQVLGHSNLFTVELGLRRGDALPVLRREAVLAELLGDGGLALALAGMMLRLANEPPVDVDEVRELLKAARQGDRFQPLLELLEVA
jgi:hypothetical protein